MRDAPRPRPDGRVVTFRDLGQSPDQDLYRCGQPAPGVCPPPRRELLARLQRVDRDQPVAAPELLPGGVREGEVALNDVDDAQVGVPPDRDGPDLVLQAE